LLGWVAGFVFCFRTVVSEEKNRAFLFLKTLPISDGELVLGKFAANFVLVSANFCGFFAYYQILLRALPPDRLASISLGVTLILLATQVLSNFIFLGIALLFDSEKAVWIPFPLIWVSATVLGNMGRVTEALGIKAGWDF